MQNTWLTQTKFVPPRLRDDFVTRSRLVDTLRAAVNSRTLTLLSAPAGYGKTTLLASLTDIPLAWNKSYIIEDELKFITIVYQGDNIGY